MMKIARKAKPTSPISSIVIQIAVMRIWHELDPAWAFNNAWRVGSYEPKGLVSPSEERTTSDLINRQIPNKRTTREGLKAIINHKRPNVKINQIAKSNDKEPVELF
jgi:hypothetical protein